MIFRRSLVNELINSAGGVFTVLFSIVLTVGLVRIFGRAVGGRIDPTAVFELMAYSSLVNLPPLLTLAVFIAVIMVLMRCWQDSEMVVWFSSGGLSLFSWINPVLRFTLPMVAIITVMSLSVTPWAKGEIDRISDQFEQRDDVNKIAPGRFIETNNGNRVFFIEDVDKTGTHVRNFFMSERGRNGEVVVRAESGQIKINEYGDRYISLNNGRRYETDSKGGSAWRVIEFDQYDVRMNVKADSVYGNRDVDEISFEKLLLLDTPRSHAQLLWRLSWPLAALNLALLAIPLSFVNPRAGRSMSLVLAVLVFILYLNSISIAQSWIKSEEIGWLTALIVINGTVALATALLFIRRVYMQRWVPVWLSELPFRIFGNRK